MTEQQELARIERNSPERLNPRALPILNLDIENTNTHSHLRAYKQILVKYRWAVLTVAFVLTTLVAIISFKMQPLYEATARVEVEAETPSIQSLNDLSRTLPTDSAFLETQVRVLESDNLAWRTIEQLGLGKLPEFSSSNQSAQRPSVDSAITAQIPLVQEFKKHLRVVLARNSRMVELNFESTDPHLAALVANAHVNNYIEYNFHKKYDATRQASSWMEQQLDELKAKVEKSQQAMVDYERRNAIVNINEKQNVVEQRLADLSKDLTVAQSDRMQKESLHRLITSDATSMAQNTQNDLLQRLEEKYANLKVQYVEASGQYGPNFPKVIRLKNQTNEVQSIIERERKRIEARIRSDYLAAAGREKLLSAEVAREKMAVGNLNQLLIRHNILKREFETNQQLYENLLQRLKDATVSAGLKANNIHVVDQALTPTVPVRPKKLFNIAIGLMTGVMLGAMFAFVKASLDNSIKTPEDIERLIIAPALATIPVAGSIRSHTFWLTNRGNKRPVTPGVVELTLLKQPASARAEAYRTLRTAILLSTAPRPPQTLLVTSSQPNEGKTCTSLNLALALAQNGARVLIIDADLRKPGIASALGVAKEKGLSSFLTGAHSLDEALQQVERLPNLWVLPSGPRPPNPAELLSSVSMQKLLRELKADNTNLHLYSPKVPVQALAEEPPSGTGRLRWRGSWKFARRTLSEEPQSGNGQVQRFDYLVLDSPPLHLVTDTTVLATLVDGVVLVVESGFTTGSTLVRAYRILENAGARILGVVLNKIHPDHDGYYGSHYGEYYQSYFNEESAEHITSVLPTAIDDGVKWLLRKSLALPPAVRNWLRLPRQ